MIWRRAHLLGTATGTVVLAVLAIVAATDTTASAAAGVQTREPRPVEQAPRQTVGLQRAGERDAQQTREELDRILGRFYPGVGRVLRLDPSLFSNEAYLSSYPALAEFLSRNPEIAHNPSYYLQNFRNDNYGDRRSPSMMFWNAILGGIAALFVFLVVTGVVVWVIRTIVDHRRWQRVSKIQNDVHTKLLDRFASSNEDLLSYIQTPAGRRFLESAPIPFDEPRRVGAPVARILWSVQAGAVLAVAGVGLLFVSRSPTFAEDAALAFFAIGVLALAIGIGFGVSAVIAFMLSRRLGLLEPPPSINA